MGVNDSGSQRHYLESHYADLPTHDPSGAFRHVAADAARRRPVRASCGRTFAAGFSSAAPLVKTVAARHLRRACLGTGSWNGVRGLWLLRQYAVTLLPEAEWIEGIVGASRTPWAVGRQTPA